MFHGNKNTGVVAALTVAVALILVSGVAYGHWRSDNHSPKDFNLGQWNERLPNQYSLSQDQLMTIDNILLDCRDEMLPLERKMRRLEQEVQSYNNNPDIQPEQIRSRRRQIRDMRDEIASLRLRANADVNKLLNNDQISYIGNDFDWYDIGYDGRMMDCDHMMGSQCRWDTYQQSNGRHGDDGCCW